MEVCIIVDAYRFSKAYVEYFKKKNIACVHVQSTISAIPDLQKSSTYDEQDYLVSYCCGEYIELLLSELREWNPVAVIAGMESGVLLADQLADALCLKSNDISKTRARRNKFDMIMALKKANLPHIHSALVKTPQEAEQWVRDNTQYPVVIKPVESAGTEGVFVCENAFQLQNNFKQIFERRNCFGVMNESVLVQEFLRGTEYMVNTVSCHGQHYLTDMWCCYKRHIKNHGMIYDREELLASDGVIQSQIMAYLIPVLNALGFGVGAAHAEVMMTDRGPILIEVGARVGGNVHAESHTACLGHNQLELNVDAYVDEVSFFQRTKKPYMLSKNAMTVVLSTQQSGEIQSIPILEKIKHCDSVFWYHLYQKPGDYLKATRDLFSSPGKVILLHENADVIRRDYQDIVVAAEAGWEVAI